MLRGPSRTKLIFGLLSLPFCLFIQGCSTSGDAMPATKVDIFVLDLSTSNDASAQLQRIKDDIFNSVTEKSLGIPKLTPEVESISGPISTVFTFIVEAAPRAETFKLQTASDVRKLWVEEFSTDTERNAKSWSQLSAEYSFYAKSILSSDSTFQKEKCLVDLNKKLKPKFMGDSKRGRIINVLCDKLDSLNTNYRGLLTYVSERKANSTDIYGMLNQVDRLVNEVKKEDMESVVTVNIASDMQHETGDLRDTPRKLNSLKLEPGPACLAGKADKANEGLTFDKRAAIRVTGIGNAKISAEYGNALIKYWQCYFPDAEIR